MIVITGKWDWLLDEMKGINIISKLPLILKFVKGRVKGPDDITKCTMCPNMCRHVCPVGIVDGSETTSPSGKSRIGFLLEKKLLPMDLENSYPLYMCLSCGCCERWCPFDFSVSDILQPVKEKMIEKEIISDEFKTIFGNLEKYKYLYGKPKNDNKYNQTNEEILYLRGCSIREYYPDIPSKAIKTINNLGERAFIIEEENCCGIPAYNLGNKKLLNKIAQENIETLNSSGVNLIVTSCPSCTYAYRVLYPLMGYKIKPRVVHILEFLNEKTNKLKLKNNKETTLTYHDPCKLANGLDKPEVLSSFIKKIENINIKTPRRNGKTTFCCGYGGSSIKRLNNNLADEIANERMNELTDLASIIITACPSCKQAFETNNKKHIKILDILELYEMCK